MPVRSCTLAKSRPTACTYHGVMAVSNARTFMRLIVFLRPYRSSLILSTILAVLSQAAAIAVIVLTGFVINELSGGQDGHYLAFLILCDPRRRPPAGGPHARAALHLGQAGDRGRVGHARRALRAPAAALVRLLRPAPDRPADVARDGRPADDPLLPRLRADLLRAARDHDRLRHRRPLLLRLAAGADRARDHAAPRRRRLPLQPRLASGPPRRAAEARGRRDRVRRSRSSASTSSSRSPRRSRSSSASATRRDSVFAESVHANTQRSLYVPLLTFLPMLAQAGVLLAAGHYVVQGDLTIGGFFAFNLLLMMLVMPLRMLGMWIGQAQRATASGRAVLRGDRRAGGGRRCPRRRRAAARARAASSSRASASATTPSARC